MNHRQKWLAISFLSALLLINFLIVPRLRADQTINARVTSVDSESGSFTASPIDSKQNLPSNFTVSLAPKAELNGLDSLKSLETGDEIIFEGNRKNENLWEAKKIQATHQSAKSKATDTLENVKQSIKGLWYSFRYNLHTDRKTYEAYAGKRMQQLRNRFDQIKNNSNRQNYSPQNAESQLNATEEKLKIMKDTQIESNWKSAKSDFESAVGKTESMLFDAAGGILSKQDLYGWRAEDTLTKLRYDIDELKAEIPQNAQQKPEINSDLQNLENQFHAAESQFEKLKSEKDAAAWESVKQDFEIKVNAAKAAYYDGLAKFGA